MKSQFLPDIVEDIEKLFQGADLSARIQYFSDRLGSELVSRFHEYAEEKEPYLRLSNVGKPLRQLWYDLKGYKGKPLTADIKLKYLYGNILELLVLFLAQEAGYAVTDEQKEVEYNGVPGKIDGKINGVLVDVKSCSSRSFDKFINGSLYSDDSFGYIPQLTGYKQALEVEKAAFIAIDKVSGKICILDLQDIGYDLTGKIAAVHEALSIETPPSRCYEPVADGKSGNLKLSTPCSYCPHAFECWKDSNNGEGLKVYYYSSGPRWLVNVAKEPRVEAG